MKTAEDSLKRFGLDYVDILLLPFSDKKEYVVFDPFVEAMSELKKQGKIRFAGIASHSPRRRSSGPRPEPRFTTW